MRAAVAGILGVLVVGALASLALAASRGAHVRAPRATGAPCVPQASGSHRLPAIDGRVPVVVHVGRTARPGAPLVLGLPGAGQTARDFASYTGYSHLADREGFSVAYPTAAGARPFWNISGVLPGKPDDVDYLRRVIGAAVQATCADPGRVGVTGVSNGGGMSARLACDAADLIAAAAPVAGGYGSLPDCHPSRPVPILEVHGDLDRVVPYNGKGPQGSGAVPAFLAQWRRLDGCPGAPRRLARFGDVVELRWSGCAGGTVVQHDRISDAEHGWPGEADVDGAFAFSSTRRTWDFLKSFRR
ncbi:MAG: alpha/beta hydrolase family esterase [Solirubrobacteraceae bacterium]